MLDAARDADNRWIFPELLAEGYEPWHGVKTVFIASAPKVTHYVDVTGFVDKGIESLKEHRVYIENLSSHSTLKTSSAGAPQLSANWPAVTMPSASASWSSNGLYRPPEPSRAPPASRA